jgi:hypothetical protein
MPYQYSCFFSYRRNEEQSQFFKNFNEIIKSEALGVTNERETFFDEKSIHQGQEFDKAIYKAIPESYFFILMSTNNYINKRDTWCAKELYRAIKVQNKIREKVPEFCFILPYVISGSNIYLPKSIDKKNAILLNDHQKVSITNKETTIELQNIRTKLYDNLLRNFKLIDGIDFELTSIPIPSDDELNHWIDEQIKTVRANEAKHQPLLKN